MYNMHKMCFQNIGKDDSLTAPNGITEAVVMKLTEGLEMQGHHLYCDNYYTSPSLFASLERSGFGACGTVRTNRRGIPREIQVAKLSKVQVLTSKTDQHLLWGGRRVLDEYMCIFF